MKRIIYFNLLITSFVIMGLEMTAARLIAPSFGNTVYTWGIVISVFLIGSSFGYTISGYLSDKKSTTQIMLVYYLFGILTLALIPKIKDTLFPYIDSFSSNLGTTIGVLALYFIPNLLFSSIVTVLMKDQLEDQVSGKVIGNLHTASAIGSVLGTLVTTFWLIPLFNIYTVINVFVIMIAVAYLFYFWNKFPDRNLILCIPILLLFLPYLSVKLESSEAIYHKTSLYHDIFIFETDEFNGKEGQLRYLTFGNKTTIQGMMDMNNPDEMILNYAKSIWEISNTFVSDSKNVFIIGHGIGTLTKQYENVNKEVTVAELDKDVLEVSKKYFEYKGNSVKIGDGRKILKDQRKKFDVIVLDAFHNTYQIPFHLISKEFFTLTRNKLEENGVLIINAIGTPKDDIVIESIDTTLKSVYPNVYIFGKENENELQNLTFVASEKKLDAKKIKDQYLMKLKKGKVILDGDTKLKNFN